MLACTTRLGIGADMVKHRCRCRGTQTSFQRFAQILGGGLVPLIGIFQYFKLPDILVFCRGRGHVRYEKLLNPLNFKSIHFGLSRPMWHTNMSNYFGLLVSLVVNIFWDKS